MTDTPICGDIGDQLRLVYQDNLDLVQWLSTGRTPQAPEGSMRLVAYTRLSQANAHEDESHEAQLARIDIWCAGLGHDVVSHRRETYSGLVKEDASRSAIEDLHEHLRQRTALADALNDLSDLHADGIIVDVRDRLSRDPLISELVLRDVWRTGKSVFSVMQGNLGDNPGDPAQRFMRTVVGAADQYVGEMTKLRMARGRRRAVEHGRLIGPAPSFGWRKDADDPGLPVPDPDTYPLVEGAVRRRNEGASLRQVAAYLEEATGRRWSASMAARVCERHRRYAVSAR